MVEAQLAAPGIPLKISAAIVVQAVKSVVAAGKEEAFLAEARDQNAFVVASPEVVNLVKSFLVTHGIHEMDLAAAALVQSPPGQDRCPPAAP